MAPYYGDGSLSSDQHLDEVPHDIAGQVSIMREVKLYESAHLFCEYLALL